MLPLLTLLAAPVLALVEPHVSDLEVVGRLAFAVLLGGMVGMERELAHQPAGLRTHITVALGAALFGVLSVHGFDAYVQARADSNYHVDVTRIASQVVVGIGFLGAGAILKEGATIRGLTTAASLWATASIGLAVGVGSFLAGFATTIALLLSLVGLRGPRRWARRRLGRGRATVVIELVRGADSAATVRALFDLPGVAVRSVHLREDEDGVSIEADVSAPNQSRLTEVFATIADRPEVASVDFS